jgi:hypothetical protein
MEVFGASGTGFDSLGIRDTRTRKKPLLRGPRNVQEGVYPGVWGCFDPSLGGVDIPNNQPQNTPSGHFDFAGLVGTTRIIVIS